MVWGGPGQNLINFVWKSNPQLEEIGRGRARPESKQFSIEFSSEIERKLSGVGHWPRCLDMMVDNTHAFPKKVLKNISFQASGAKGRMVQDLPCYGGHPLPSPLDHLKHVITRAPEVRLTLWLVHSAWFFKPRRLSMVSEPDSCQKAQF